MALTQITAGGLADDSVDSDAYVNTSIDAAHLASGVGVEGWTKLSTTTASNSGTVDITSGFSSTYDDYIIVVHDAYPVSDEVELYSRLRINGSFKSDDNYCYHVNRSNDDAHTYSGTGTNRTDVCTIITGSWGNQTGEGIDGFYYVFNANEANRHQKVMWNMVFDGGGGNQNAVGAKGVGTYQDGSVGAGNMVCSGVQFIAGSGSNISAGDFILYGLVK